MERKLCYVEFRIPNIEERHLIDENKIFGKFEEDEKIEKKFLVDEHIKIIKMRIYGYPSDLVT